MYFGINRNRQLTQLNMKKSAYYLLILTFTFCSFQSFGQVIEIQDVRLNELKIQGFKVTSPTDINVKGSAGVFFEDWQRQVYYGWVLNLDTKKVEWHMFDALEARDKYIEEGVFEIEDNITLSPGNYQLIYTSAVDNNNNEDWGFDTFNDFMDHLFSSRRSRDYYRRNDEILGISLKGNSLQPVNADDQLNVLTKDAIVSLNKVGDYLSLNGKFTLTKDSEIHIYALGEGNRDEMYDYAWIYDASNHKKIWQMEYSNSYFAGGARKNLVFDNKIKLPAGSYIVNYSTDDSHSYRKWNLLPPDDPQHWGVTVWAANSGDKSNFVAFDPSDVAKPLVEIIGVGDDAYISQGLKLNEDAMVRIQCYGEGGYDDLADAGWIIDANSRKVIWEINSRNSDYAGGDEKNKITDDLIELKKGEYIVYYATDGSHSFNKWNASPPIDKERYGITIWPENKKVKYELFDERSFKNENVLVEIVKVHDRAYLKETFELKGDTKLRIHAIGEGRDGYMYDFGWIENADNGRVVWEMTYRNSDHAGGASKNRMYNDVIILPKGNYKIYYQTDGSHSYRNWNDTPPADAENYGIALLLEK